jgi:hypothetical protein
MNNLYDVLLRESYTYKKTMGGLDNVTDNSNHVRVFRDMSTELFTNVMIGQEGVPQARQRDDMLRLFLDYTFHRIYSEVIGNINTKLIEALPINIAANNGEKHIKPLVGIERIFLIFKGGTLMKNYFDDFIDDLNIDDFTTDNVKQKYPNIINPNFISNLNFNLDANNLMNMRGVSEGVFFKNNILKPNFKISDTDYSLFINARTTERYMVIHRYAVELLGRAFDKMTNECDEYYTNVNNNNVQNNNIHPNILASDETIPIDNNNNDLLENLQKYLDNNNNIRLLIRSGSEAEINNSAIEVQFRNSFLSNINDFLQNFTWIPFSNMFQCYINIQIISLITYIGKLNPRIFDYINNVSIIDINGNAIVENRINEIILNQMKNFIMAQMEIFVCKKFEALKRNEFYTIEKFNIVKDKLREKYMANVADPNNSMFREKYDGGPDPSYIESKRDTYLLNRVSLQNSPLIVNDFQFQPRNSALLLSKNSATDINNIIDINNPKVHYVTYNETIRKTRALGSNTTDFDLIRSKFNIIINKPGIATKNQQEHLLKIPSEFIDVSIPRYEDSSRRNFFKHIQHHGYEPVKLSFRNQDSTTLIYTYSPSEVLEDLLYTLFNQNSFEPWLDKKYTKRILRAIVLILIIIRYEVSLLIAGQQNIEREKNIKTYINVFKLCYSIHEYVKNIDDNPGIAYPYPFHLVAQFIDGYDYHENDANPELAATNDPNNIKIREYLIALKQLSRNWLIEKENLLHIYIHKKYEIVSELVKNTILWSFIYEFTNEEKIQTMNFLSLYYLQTPLYDANIIYDNANPDNPNNLKSIEYAKKSFVKLLKFVYDYGFKLIYLIDNENNNPRNINIAHPQFGGNNSDYNYYKKYLKYKNKYLLKN